MGWTLVTGGAKRLGAEICRSLAAAGKDLLIHYRESCSEAESVAAECAALGVKAELLKADLSSVDGVNGLVKTIKQRKWPVENLINNVGNFYKDTLLNTKAVVWYDLFQTNLHAPFLLSQGLIDSIKTQQGSIINIGTAGALDLRADKHSSAYMITKKALYQLSKSLAREVAKDGVRVNMVSPGVLINSVSVPEDPESIPQARLGELREISRVVLFLLDRNNAYITGQNIEVAGGYAL